MFNDDGLGQAMTLHYAEKAGKDAQSHVAKLEARVAELERQMGQVHQILEHQMALNKIWHARP
jgi:uncharacterized protein YceH (UPF0502 family)